MQKEVLLFKQKHSVNLPLIVHHFLKLGEHRCLRITEKEIEEVRKKTEHDEAAAKKRGAILLLTPEFQCYIVKACKDLAQLTSNKDLSHDANILIAQALCSTEDYLKETNFDDIQKEYWTQIIQQYLEALSDDDEREEFQRLLEDDGYEEVIENILNDDETWRVIDDSLEYYITHLK